MTAAAASTSERLVLLAKDIKLSHSVFALPFALLAGFMAAASQGEMLSLEALGLLVLCMVLARTVAMTMNRWADRYLDGLNPRTAQRAIPSGQLDDRFVLNTAIACALSFVIAAGGFYFASDGNLWPLILSPVAMLWLVSYSFTKRFTWLCHLFLGVALAISPAAAAIAIAPQYLAEPGPYVLAFMVMCWVAGFDIIYAMQDTEVDRSMGIHSIPARLGDAAAMWISRLLHASALAALIGLCQLDESLGPGFAVGTACVAALLALEHTLVWRSKTHHIHVAFFVVNGAISLLLGALGIIDVMLYLAGSPANPR